MVGRLPAEGGTPERQLAERYTGFATTIGDQWPRTAAILRRFADEYLLEARSWDQESELCEDLIR
jgi:hypothetical protein